MSVACDDGSFSSPKSSHEGVLGLAERKHCLSLWPANYVSKRSFSETKCGAETLRATLVTPPPCGHPLYKQRGSWEDSQNNLSIIQIIRFAN